MKPEGYEYASSKETMQIYIDALVSIKDSRALQSSPYISVGLVMTQLDDYEAVLGHDLTVVEALKYIDKHYTLEKRKP